MAGRQKKYDPSKDEYYYRRKYNEYLNYSVLNTYATSSNATIYLEPVASKPKPKTAVDWLREQVEVYCALGRTLD